MATEIVISNGDYIKVDDFRIEWAKKGDSMPALLSGQPGDNNIHYIIYNTLSGDNEIQYCGPSGKMKGNTDLNSNYSDPDDNS